mgnify:CR=1 FL=1
MKMNLTPYLLALLTFMTCLVFSEWIPANGVRSAAVSRSIFSAAVDGHEIKGIGLTSENAGYIFTSSYFLRTENGGKSWITVDLPIGESEAIEDIVIANGRGARVVVIGERGVSMLLPGGGGSEWLRLPINLESYDQKEIGRGTISIDGSSDELTLNVILPSSSNFLFKSRYISTDGGLTWLHQSRESRPKSDADDQISADFNMRKIKRLLNSNAGVVSRATFGDTEWLLIKDGNCTNGKIDCQQTTDVIDVSSGTVLNITPPAIKTLAAKAARDGGIFSTALPPGGSTRTSLNRGFDKCTAATSSQMQTWWDSSPYYDANIYISGRNRGCTQAQLTSTWINNVSTQGWGLIPTIVGYQSPCSSCTSCLKHSSDSTTAEQEGRAEADIAITDASALGLSQGTVLYYDMERYDDTSGTGACSTPTKAFLKGWTDRLKERGYISGVYGSPTNATNDWLNLPAQSRPDAVWLARWDNVMSVWTFTSTPVPDSAWSNHQRIKQWKAPFNDTWGGVTFNIDGNIADGPVAGIQLRNRRADFDGDGKTDIAVFRPETGTWYLLNSSDSNFRAISFGNSTDVVSPGDFDGDGKTDVAIWRPSTGVWHVFSRSIYTAFQFGAQGDIPVPADYDGDGRTDFAVYRPSNGVWYIKNSLDSRGTSFRFEQFGLVEDIPTPGDYDGDGRADLAVFRPSSGVWYRMGSTAGFSGVQFGSGTDITAAGDYDGDGKTDVAVYRPSSGIWYILGSQAGFYGFQWGLNGDRPSAGDFDGDGKTDAAVFRPSNGVWFVLASTRGYFAVQFGLTNDRPISAAYSP